VRVYAQVLWSSVIALAVLVCAWPACRCYGAEAQAPAAPPAIAEIIGRIQASDSAAAQKLAKDLVNLGPQGIADLCGLVVEPGKTDDSKTRFALHGLAMYASRPGAEAERLMVCEAYRKMLAGPAPAAVKGFFLRQLRLVGCPKAVAAISEHLLNEDLCEYAAQALLSIGGDAAAEAMRQALPKAKGKCRLTLIQDLGVARDAKAAPDLLKAAADADREVRLAALFGLGNIGDAAAAGILLKAADADSLYERSRATDAALLLAKRLGEAGKINEAERVYRTLLKTRSDPRDRHVRCAAIHGLAAVLGPGAVDDVLAAMESSDPQVRAAAAEVAVTMSSPGASAKWVAAMKAATPAGKIGLLAVLARIGGPAAEKAVMDELGAGDDTVRLAAIAAAAGLKGKGPAQALLAVMALDPKEHGAARDAARKSLEHMPGEEASAAVAGAVATAPAPLKKELLAVLVARGARAHVDAIIAATKDADAGVRHDALGALAVLAGENQIPMLVDALAKAKDDGERGDAEKALGSVCSRMTSKEPCVERILPAMGGADVSAKAALVRVLAKAACPRSLDAVRAAVRDADAVIQEAAVRAMSEWPDPSAGPDLLEIARTGAKPAFQVLALRGYVRLANVPQDRPPAQRLKMYEEALAAAKRPDEKRLVLAALGEMKVLGALKMAAPLMGDDALKEEAAAAVVRIARNMGDGVKTDAAAADVRAAVARAAEVAKSDNVRKDAEGVMQKIDKR
jgi:HEAT repeat protein